MTKKIEVLDGSKSKDANGLFLTGGTIAFSDPRYNLAAAKKSGRLPEVHFTADQPKNQPVQRHSGEAPDVELARRGAELAKAEKCDIVLAMQRVLKSDPGLAQRYRASFFNSTEPSI